MPVSKHASKFGTIRVRRNVRDKTLRYEQRGGYQSTADRNGVSLDAHIHALYGIALQHPGTGVLMIGCAGGTLATMLVRAKRKVVVVDIDKVSIALARRYFGLPRSVTCHVTDGLVFLQRNRKRYDVLVMDVFVGENIPAHMKSAEFFAAAKRAVRKNGVILVNVCLASRRDPIADKIAAGFRAQSLPVRVLDSPGGERNAIVLAGNVRQLRPPKMLLQPDADAKQTIRELKAMHFRRRRSVS